MTDSIRSGIAAVKSSAIGAGSRIGETGFALKLSHGAFFDFFVEVCSTGLLCVGRLSYKRLCQRYGLTFDGGFAGLGLLTTWSKSEV